MGGGGGTPARAAGPRPSSLPSLLREGRSRALPDGSRGRHLGKGQILTPVGGRGRPGPGLRPPPVSRLWRGGVGQRKVRLRDLSGPPSIVESVRFCLGAPEAGGAEEPLGRRLMGCEYREGWEWQGRAHCQHGHRPSRVALGTPCEVQGLDTLRWDS